MPQGPSCESPYAAQLPEPVVGGPQVEPANLLQIEGSRRGTGREASKASAQGNQERRFPTKIQVVRDQGLRDYD